MKNGGHQCHECTSSQVSIDKLGYESLRPKQETVVWEFLSGKDVFVALPTGYGKSCLFAMRFGHSLVSRPLPSFPSHCKRQEAGRGPGNDAWPESQIAVQNSATVHSVAWNFLFSDICMSSMHDTNTW